MYEKKEGNMKKCMALFAFAVFTFIFVPEALFAQRGGRTGGTIEVRLASPLPRNSDWGRTLDRIAAEWARVTNNEVRLRVLHDGVEGTEARKLSSLNANNIQASLFTSFGLAKFCPEIMTLSIPFLIRNNNELDLVMREVEPILESKMAATNFVVLAYSQSGWVNIFSREPVFTPEQLRRHRVATNPDSAELNTAFRTMGFHLVETDIVDIGTRLANNMINAIYQTPAAVAPLGIHRNLGHMMDIPIAPFIGAIVINRVTWNELGPQRQQDILRVTRRIAAEFDATMPRTVENAMTMMQREGLTVNRVTREQEALWEAELQRALPSLLGPVFDRDLYERIKVILEQIRSGQ
jgi:TRAP-type C4-dicarboxylate transport system substrate-binding protein